MKQPNTISSPLILTWMGTYKVNKPYDQSGEYVDKQIANKLLEALEKISKLELSFEELNPECNTMKAVKIAYETLKELNHEPPR